MVNVLTLGLASQEMRLLEDNIEQSILREERELESMERGADPPKANGSTDGKAKQDVGAIVKYDIVDTHWVVIAGDGSAKEETCGCGNEECPNHTRCEKNLLLVRMFC